MLLKMKVGEHLRLTHDSEHGAFRVYLENGAIHVTALDPKDEHDTTVVVAPNNLKLEH